MKIADSPFSAYVKKHKIAGLQCFRNFIFYTEKMCTTDSLDKSTILSIKCL